MRVAAASGDSPHNSARRDSLVVYAGDGGKADSPRPPDPSDTQESENAAV